MIPLPLADTHGRIATDLRVSLTDKCNLRCKYCMPAEGLQWLPKAEQLTGDELARLIRIAVEHHGITKVRFTGGEPLLRPELEQLVAATAALTPRPDISITSNGIGLERRAEGLVAAGLDRVNISLDTLDRERFAQMTRRDRLPQVLRGLEAAAEAGLTPVKINSVLLRGINDDEAPALLRFALDHGYELRFIEQMPLDAGHGWTRADMVTADEILAALQAEFELTPEGQRGSAPAERFLVDGGPETVGVIGSVTRPFCGDCDRTRLTSDGQMRTCLFSLVETDLRALVRSDATDEQIAAAWAGGMRTKLAGHHVNDEGFVQPTRPMSAIGG